VHVSGSPTQNLHLEAARTWRSGPFLFLALDFLKSRSHYGEVSKEERMSVYTVRVNGRTSIVTDVLSHLFARLHDLRSAAGPVTVEAGGRELKAIEVEELMLAYHEAA
jgi:hypothetical protein